MATVDAFRTAAKRLESMFVGHAVGSFMTLGASTAQRPSLLRPSQP